MKDYFESVLRYTAYLFGSMFLCGLAGPLVGIFLMTPLFEGKVEYNGTFINIVNYIYNFLSMTVLPLVLIYIAMRRAGYKRNTAYAKNLLTELLITAVISIIIFSTADVAMDFVFSGQIRSFIIFLTVDTTDLLAEEIREKYFSIYIISAVLQSVMCGLVMVAGFCKGYKIRGNDRTEIMANNKIGG